MDLPDLGLLHRPGGSKYGLRERIAANLDDALTQITLPNERFLWEISPTLVPELRPGPMGAQIGGNMRTWLSVLGPSPILGGGWLISAQVFDLPVLATDKEAALAAVRHLVENVRKAQHAQRSTN